MMDKSCFIPCGRSRACAGALWELSSLSRVVAALAHAPRVMMAGQTQRNHEVGGLEVIRY